MIDLLLNRNKLIVSFFNKFKAEECIMLCSFFRCKIKRIHILIIPLTFPSPCNNYHIFQTGYISCLLFIYIDSVVFIFQPHPRTTSSFVSTGGPLLFPCPESKSHLSCALILAYCHKVVFTLSQAGELRAPPSVSPCFINRFIFSLES